MQSEMKRRSSNMEAGFTFSQIQLIFMKISNPLSYREQTNKALKILTSGEKLIYNRSTYHNYGNIIHYLKLDVSETGFCLRFQVEPTQVSPTESSSLCLRTRD
jgi:hypothetical protein